MGRDLEARPRAREDLRALLPPARARRRSSASKKRYAGRSSSGSDEVEIAGLEAVRRDWPRVAAQLQLGPPGATLRGSARGSSCPFARDDRGTALREGRRRRRARLREARPQGEPRPLYGELAAPRPGGAQARRAAPAASRGPWSATSITSQRAGADVCRARPVPAGVDHRHYVERVLRPVGDAILEERWARSFDDVLGEPRQMGLF